MSIDHRTEILKADVSSVSPLSQRIEELWLVFSRSNAIDGNMAT